MLKNNLQPGDKLPTEKELSDMFGVGRSSVREAMQTLQGLGVVEVIQGKGAFLTEGSFEVLKDQLLFALGYGSTAVTDLTEARRILEVAAARMAALRATEEEISQMVATISRMRAGTSQSEILKAGLDFHLVVTKAAHNPLVTKMLEAIWGVIYDTFAGVIRTSETLDQSIAEHERILQCIRKGDPEAAARAMEVHLQALEERLLADVRREATGEAGWW